MPEHALAPELIAAGGRPIASPSANHSGAQAVRTAGFFFSGRSRHTRSLRDWSSDVCSSDLQEAAFAAMLALQDRALETIGPGVPLAAVELEVADLARELGHEAHLRHHVG